MVISIPVSNQIIDTRQILQSNYIKGAISIFESFCNNWVMNDIPALYINCSQKRKKYWLCILLFFLDSFFWSYVFYSFRILMLSWIQYWKSSRNIVREVIWLLLVIHRMYLCSSMRQLLLRCVVRIVTQKTYAKLSVVTLLLVGNNILFRNCVSLFTMLDGYFSASVPKKSRRRSLLLKGVEKVLSSCA